MRTLQNLCDGVRSINPSARYFTVDDIDGKEHLYFFSEAPYWRYDAEDDIGMWVADDFEHFLGHISLPEDTDLSPIKDGYGGKDYSRWILVIDNGVRTEHEMELKKKNEESAKKAQERFNRWYDDNFDMEITCVGTLTEDGFFPNENF